MAEGQGRIVIDTLGLKGVNVDKNPLELDPAELTVGQNCISDPSSGRSSLRKRPGLGGFTTSAMSGAVLGGIGVPLLDLSHVGTIRIYIGRGPT